MFLVDSDSSSDSHPRSVDVRWPLPTTPTMLQAELPGCDGAPIRHRGLHVLWPLSAVPTMPRRTRSAFGGLCAWGLLSRYLWSAAPTAPRRDIHSRLAPDTADPNFRGLCTPPSPPPALAAGFLHVRSPSYFLPNLHASVQRLHAGSGRPKRPQKTLRWDRPLSSPLCRGSRLLVPPTPLPFPRQGRSCRRAEVLGGRQGGP